MPIKRSRTKSRKRGGGNKNGPPSVASNMKETNAPPGLNAPSVLPEEQLEASLAKEPPPEAPGGAELQNRARPVAPSPVAQPVAQPVEPQEQSSGTSNAVEITGKALTLATAADNMARSLEKQDNVLVNKAVGNIIGGSYSKKHRKHKSKSRRRPTRMNKSPRMNKSTRMNKSKKYKKSRRRRR